MKLLFLTEFYPQNNQLIFTGGVEARMYYIVERAKQDYEVQVIASASKQIPATPISIFSRTWYMIRSFSQALTADFDLIEASNVVTYLPAWLAAKLKGKPVVAWIPDVLGKSWFDFGFFVGLTGLIAEWLALQLSWTKIIALSQSTAAKLVRAGIQPKNITVVHAGIDLQEFK